MPDAVDFNARTIAEFRAGHGQVGGNFAAYQRKTDRIIPVIALTPAEGTPS